MYEARAAVGGRLIAADRLLKGLTENRSRRILAGVTIQAFALGLLMNGRTGCAAW